MIRRIWQSLRPNRRNREIDDEFEFHVAMRARDLEAGGMTPAEAARVARAKFGASASIREATREAHLVPALETLFREATYSLRALRRRPVLLVTGVATLALGIGFNLTIGAAVDALLFRPLPVPEPERLVVFVEKRNGESLGGNPERLRDYSTMVSLTAMAGFYSERIAMTTADGARGLSALRFYGDVFQAFGYRTAIGRAFTASELEHGGEVVVLGHRFWQREFGGRADAIGRTLATRNGAFRVVGVLGPEASLIEDYDLWLPAGPTLGSTPRTAGFLMVIARLRAGATLAGANSELQARLAAMTAAHPATDTGMAARVAPLDEVLAGEARRPALLLLSVVLVVLLAACVNLAGLLVARHAEREREISIRLSIGATRWDLTRLFLWEALWLSGLGGVCAIGAAYWSLDLFVAQIPPDIPLRETMRIDARMIVYAALLAALCGIVTGWVPAWRAARARIGHGRLRAGLVAAQIAISMALVTAAMLFTASLHASKSRLAGFSMQNAVAVEFDFPWDTEARTLHRFYERVETELQTIPGVRAAGIGDSLPLLGHTQTRSFLAIHGVPLDERLARTRYGFRAAGAGYFAALRIPLRRGRWPRPVREPDDPRETVVNEAFVRRYLGGRDPLGQRASFSDANREPRWYTITGVVPDVAATILDSHAMPSVYVDYHHAYWPRAVAVLHGTGDTGSLVRAARAKISGIDRYAMLRYAGPAEARIETAWREPGLVTALVAGMSALTLALVCLGVYGVTASTVRARTREYGIRAALGATPVMLLRLSLSQGLRIAAAGITLGVLFSAPVSRLIETLLPGGAPAQLPILAAAVALLVLLVCLATAGPSRRAARTDPAIVLRHE